MRASLLLVLAVVSAHAAVTTEKIENVRALLRDHKIPEAESAVNALVAANPAAAEAHILLGSVRTAKGDGDGAVQACEKAIELAPTNSDYHRQLGDACGLAAQNAGMFSKMSLGKKCLAAYEKAVALDPANLAARSSLVTVYQQAPAVMGGGSDKAYAQAAEIKKLDAPRGHLVFAALYAGDKKFDAALAELDEILKTAPDNYAALYQVGKLAATSGQFLDRGLTSLRRCVTLAPGEKDPPHPAAYWRTGNILEKKNDLPGARAAYEAALKLDPKYAQAADALKKLK